MRGEQKMATFLLIIIYIAFIGLGLPNSLFGTAWPAIYSEFHLPLSYGSFITVIVSCGTILSSVFSARIINRFGTGRVSAVSTLLTAAALLGFSISPNLLMMCLLAVPLGIGAGSIDVALNNYVALHYSATHMNFLHCFYGIGVSVSPYILSMVMDSKAGWRGGYRIAFAIQLGIAVLLFLTQPLWAKNKKEEIEGKSEGTTLSFREALKIPGVKGMCCLFFITCSIECTCSGWGSTFLVEYKHLSADQAARVILLYFVGMAAGRFLSGVLASRLHSWTIIILGQCILGLAVVLLFLPGSIPVCTAALFLIGLGNGPMFPNFNYLTPENFGEEVSQSVIGVQMAFAYVGIMVAPLLCSVLGQLISMAVFPVYLFCFYVVMTIVLISVKRRFKKVG